MYKPKKIVFHKDCHPRFPTTKDVKKMQKSKPQNARLHSRVKPFGDLDKDKTPNFIDCHPRNPNKHAVSVGKTKFGAKYIIPNLARMSETFAKGARKVGVVAIKGVEKAKKIAREYPEQAAARRQAEITRLRAQAKLEKERETLRRLREKRAGGVRGGLGFNLGGYSGIGESLFEGQRKRRK